LGKILPNLAAINGAHVTAAFSEGGFFDTKEGWSRDHVAGRKRASRRGLVQPGAFEERSI
jgi:hypothetical protein